jgi:hypothetical protein
MEDDDSAETLAKQLGVTTNDIGAIGEDKTIRLSKLRGNVGLVFGKVESLMSQQSNNPSSIQVSNCAQTAKQLAFSNYRNTERGLIPATFDDEIKKNTTLYLRKSPGSARVRDIIRYADANNVAQHFTTFLYFENRNGTVPHVFSQSGIGGRFEHGPASMFEGKQPGEINYGTIRGINPNDPKDSGYYRPH